ncbi:MAG: nicotinamide-nucleotide amidohydrolase family protein [Planctomycetaceae bacterium]|nr:nicotinamide-nucleotide amidohydrolase family protein [Planctomycetaceae bacterium]
MSIASSARRVARLLAASGLKVVFAESCTGGLVSGALTRIPGISEHHCGGMVVYRNETKMAYLGIPPAVLDGPGPVSREVAELMATSILQRTAEAGVSIAVTGHLGPGAPAGMDGLVYIAAAVRKPTVQGVWKLRCRRTDSRVMRQRWVVDKALTLLADTIDGLKR